MSTKIYNGFCFRPAHDFEQVLHVVRGFRPWLEEAGCRLFERYCARASHPNDPAVCWATWCEDRRKVKKTGERNPWVDTDFEATFFPLAGDVLLGITFTEQHEWHEEWLKQPGVSEFGYWNNTDRPEHLSALEWDERQRLWELALPGAGVPAVNGFTIAIANPRGPDLSRYLR